MSENGSLEPTGVLYHPQKGDVCYVPWRKQYWPSLVKNSYPKKISYAFFPLPENDKATTFTLSQPKKAMHLSLHDEAPPTASYEFNAALAAAKEYVQGLGMMEGWKCNAFDPTNAFNFGIKRPHANNNDDSHIFGDDDNDETDSVTLMNNDEDRQESGSSTDPEDPDENNQPRVGNTGAGDPSAVPKVKKRRLDNAPYGAKESTGVTIPAPSFKRAPAHCLKYNKNLSFHRILFENLDVMLNEAWESPQVKNYRPTPRPELKISFSYAKVLTDVDSDLLFEHCLDYAKSKEPLARSLPCLELVANFLLPEVILRAVMIERKMSYDEAVNYMISYTGNGPNDPEMNAGLNALCSAACEEAARVEGEQSSK